ncbi:MAG: DAK2 domain-containing protein [Lachnospiraceae bacterium]|nr:DAK2 domain-containing protein [Lachnospiraceae bacterium]
MALNTIDAKMLAKMFLAGAKNLEVKKEWINELNVFPVPDGDTGTNMTMTIMSAAREVNALGEAITMESLCKAISSGSLRGARGNSGVILSQLFRGFTRGIKDVDTITIAVLADAFDKAVETAYKAVMKPKEGTILTVAKGAAAKARELADNGADNMEDFLGAVIEHARYVLSKTPEMLPVLKQAGVVDSGGQGLVEVLSGAYDAFLGKEINLDFDAQPASRPISSVSNESMNAQAEAEIKFGYCTEFIILLNKTFNIKHEMDFKAYLESIGDSIVCVADDDVVKVHVHTNDPGLAIQKALKYGALSNMKIDNMRLEHQEKLFKMSEKQAAEGKTQETAAPAEKPEPAAEEPAKEQEPPKPVGFIAVSIGEGVNEIFKSLGVDYIIEGGQTMNPSTADILDAVDKVNAETIFVLPNNKNIILAANQAAELMTDKNLLVIPSKTIPQGITAVINYVPELSVDENEEAMLQEIGNVKTGQVTYAVRDTMIDDKEIKEGDFMGIGDKGILSVGQDMLFVTEEMVSEMVDDDSELISIYYGADVTEEDAEKLRTDIEAAYPSCDVELQFGGQPIYYYVISV